MSFKATTGSTAVALDTIDAREIIGKPAVVTSTIVALNTTVDRAVPTSFKHVTTVDLVENPLGLKTTTVHVEGQVSNTPRQSATDPSKSDTTSNNCTMVDKSPSKNQSPGLQNQIVPSKVIGVSASFDALVNKGEHAMKEAKNMEQQMDETRSVAGKTSSTGSEKQ